MGWNGTDKWKGGGKEGEREGEKKSNGEGRLKNSTNRVERGMRE